MRKIDKPFSKFLLGVGVTVTALFILDALSYIFTGFGLFDQIFGGKSPLLVAIAGQVAQMPLWAFLLICAAAVIVLAYIMALVMVGSYRKELIR